jgi:hypothetical protein
MASPKTHKEYFYDARVWLEEWRQRYNDIGNHHMQRVIEAVQEELWMESLED